MSAQLIANHTYTLPGQKILIQKTVLKNGDELVSTSSFMIQDPEKTGSAVLNL